MSEAEDVANSGCLLSDQERELTQNALTEFNKANYTGCLQLLNKLESRAHDYKVVHNRAVADYYKSELRKTDHFRKALNAVFSQARIRPEVVDDVDQCVAQYNLAVLLYHQQQYAASLRIVSRLFSFIEPMDDVLSNRVCLLLIELHLATYQPEKGISLINYIENQILNPETPILLSGDKEVKILKKGTRDKKKVDFGTEVFQNKLTQYRARCDLMLHDLKAASQDIKDLLLVGGVTAANICLRAHYEYLIGMHRKAIKLLQSFSPEGLDFKSCGESSSVIFWNNLGILHHALGKPHLAAHYLQRSLKEDEANIASLPKSEPNEPLSGRPLYTVGGSRKHELMFNLGVVLLFAGRPSNAFDCLVLAVQRYHRNPRLWLRLAECCIQTHKMSNKVDFDPKRQHEIINKQIVSGKYKKVLLTTNISNDKKYSAESQSYAVPVPNLEFASLCLRNALLLLPIEVPSTVTPPTTLTGPGGAPPPSGPSVSPSPTATQNEITSLRSSVLTASCYVSLCLGDYVMTYEYAKKLLGQPTLSGVHNLLGNMYAAEALVLMNKIPEAMAHLNPELVQDISVGIETEVNGSKGDKSEFTMNTKPPTEWYPNSLETAHSTLRYNLAVAMVLRGDLDRAADTLKQLWLSRSSKCNVPIHVVMLVLYVELQRGHTDVVRALIKQHCT